MSGAVLTGEVEADLVVVGGGYTGCSAALHAAASGARVILLEAETVGHGGSGRNVGLVNAGLWVPPDLVERRLGAERGGYLNAVLAAGPDEVFDLIEKHGIECEAVRAGTLHCAHSKAGLDDLRERLCQQRARGAPVELLSADDTARMTGSASFYGALLDSRAGTIQPLAYCRGLARAAANAGAKVHERSPVTRIRRTGDRWRVTTAAGTVAADALLLCTNAYHRAIRGAGAPRYTTLSYFQLATPPLDDALAGKILPGKQGCWDTALVMSSFRVDAAGRLIVGGVGALAGAGSLVHRSWARRKLATLFPAAAHCRFEHAGYGRIAMTGDRLPRLVEIGPRAISVFGYNGRGISPGTVFGRAAAEFLLGAGGGQLPLPVTSMPRAGLRGLAGACYELGAAAWHLAAARRLRP